MGLVKCANCGQSIDKKRDVCPFCGVKGEKLRGTPLPARPPSETTSPEGALPVGDASSAATFWQRRRNVVIVGVAIVALLIVTAVGAGVVMHGGSIATLDATGKGCFEDRSNNFAVGVDDTVVIHVSALPLKKSQMSAFRVVLQDTDGNIISEVGEAANTSTNYTARERYWHAGDYYVTASGFDYEYSISVETE